MKTDDILAALSGQDPNRAAATLSEALRQVLSELDDEARKTILLNLTRSESPDKVSSMAHL